MSTQITVYTNKTCGPCLRLKRRLDEAGVSFREVLIDDDPATAQRIEAATGGYRTVPTVEIGGRLFVNPLPNDVVALAAGD